MQEIVFTVRLTSDGWDEAMHGWRCNALNVPGAIVEALYVEGNRIDTARYEVLGQNTFIRWIAPDQPQRAAASVKLTETLSLGTETERWRRLAIILPVAATILAATITAAATYLARTPNVHTANAAARTQAGDPTRSTTALPDGAGGHPIDIIANGNTSFANALGIEPDRTYLTRFGADDASRYFGFHQKAGANDVDIAASLVRPDTGVLLIIAIYSSNGTKLFSRWHENNDGNSITWTKPIMVGDYVIEIKPNGASGNSTRFLLSLSSR